MATRPATSRLFLAAAAHVIVATVLLTGGEAAFAGTVVLKDGTIIHGEVESLRDGIYTIQTGSLGPVQVSKDQIRSIDPGDDSSSGLQTGPAPGPASSPLVPDLAATKSRITEDPKLMALLLGLENDPQVLEVVEDPDVMKAIAAGDYTALMNNPKIVALMSNAKVRELIDAVQ